VDFATSLPERVQMLAGLDASALDDVRRELVLAAERDLRTHAQAAGLKLAIVSGASPDH
jgi:phosphoserine phosphatase